MYYSIITGIHFNTETKKALYFVAHDDASTFRN